MTITQTTNTWALECSDDEYYHKNAAFHSRLFMNCQSLKKVANDSRNFTLDKLTNTIYKISGKVIFKAEFLIIIEGAIRVCLVLNNEFRFGNANYIGNKNIDHTSIQLDDIIEVTGTFRLDRIFLCIFTFFPDETYLPNVDYEWALTHYYRIDESVSDIEHSDLSEFTQVDTIDSSSNTIYDTYLMEFKLLDCTPKPFDSIMSGFNGFVNTICWIDHQNWVKNCEGRLVNGIKKGIWKYCDKAGKNEHIFEYED